MTTRSAPPGPSDSINCAIRSIGNSGGLSVRRVYFSQSDGKRDQRVEHFRVGERQEERSDDESQQRGGQRRRQLAGSPQREKRADDDRDVQREAWKPELRPNLDEAVVRR